MLFEQNITSNVTRNPESIQITNLNKLWHGNMKQYKTRQTPWNHSESLLETYRNLLNIKEHNILDFHKTSDVERRRM